MSTKEATKLARIPETSLKQSCCSKTHWWERDSAWVDGSCCYSRQMERIPVSSRMFLWCHFNLKSRLITGETRSKERRQTIFSKPPNHIGNNPDEEEEPSEDFSKPRKIHHHSKRKSGQDAVNSINWARAPDTRLQFCQTRSHAIFVGSSVLAHCIYNEISPKWERTLYEKNLDASACSEDCSQECLAISAATRHIGEFCFKEHQKTGAKRGARYHNRQSRTTEHLCPDAKCWVTCWERSAWILSPPQNWKNPEEEERMKNIQKVVDKLRTGYHTQSITGEDKKIHQVQRRVESYNSRTG